jgi:ribosomal protein L7/L12
MHSLIGVLVVLVGLTMVATVESRARRLDRRMMRLEHKVDLLLRHEGIQDDDPVLAEVAALARAGQNVTAIKKYREATGAGLLEAKEAVERLQADG